MSSTTAGHQGLEAVKAKNWAAAIPLLDKALESSTSPTWLLARSNAHCQLKNFDAALHDAELAYHAAAERGSGSSRKQMIEAQYRRAVIYFKLGRFADSDCCAKWSMLLSEGRPAREDDGVEKQVDEAGNYTVTVEDAVADKTGQPGQASKIGGLASLTAIADSSSTPRTGFEADWNRAYAWRSQALGTLRKLPAGDPGWKVSVSKIPPKPETKKKKAETVEIPQRLSPELKPVEKPAPAPGSVPDEKMKLRVDFYQTNQSVTVTLFVKDVNKDQLNVEFAESQVRISPIPREAAPYVKPGDREATSTLGLGGPIVPSGSRWLVTPRKIELALQKAKPGVKWGKWGEEKIGSVDFTPEAKETTVPTPAAPKENIAPKAAAPAYPTSSKSGPKDWDKLEDADDDDDKQDVNYFFKKLYSGATPEQQRAMMKSFTESNGTALSTDWNDVKSRKVETIPPEGVEAKKWEQ